MAETVNSQITDAVTQTNGKVLGNAPATAMGNLYQITAQALSTATLNSTTAQQNANTAAQVATTMGVARLYSLDVAAAAEGAQAVLQPPTAGLQPEEE